MSSTTAKSECPTRDEFRKACAQFATGITVVTTLGADGSPHGMTANSFTSVSAQPPLILVCIDLKCSILEHFNKCSHFAVNILSEHQRPVSVRFARSTEGRFDGIEWKPGQHGVPVLTGTLGVMECAVERRMTVGDHLVLVGEVRAVEIHGGPPLLYFASGYRHLRDE